MGGERAPAHQSVSAGACEPGPRAASRSAGDHGRFRTWADERAEPKGRGWSVAGGGTSESSAAPAGGLVGAKAEVVVTERGCRAASAARILHKRRIRISSQHGTQNRRARAPRQRRRLGQRQGRGGVFAHAVARPSGRPADEDRWIDSTDPSRCRERRRATGRASEPGSRIRVAAPSVGAGRERAGIPPCPRALPPHGAAAVTRDSEPCRVTAPPP